MGPWEKLQLGWLDYSVVVPGAERRDLSPATHPSEAVIVDVPDQAIATDYTTAYSGTHAWWTGSADDLNTTLENSVDLAGVCARDLDGQGLVRHRGGLRLPVRRVLDRWRRHMDPDRGLRSTAPPTDKWTACGTRSPAAADTQFRFRYQTDGGVHCAGAFIDDITIKNGGTTLFSDDVEGGDRRWTADGGFKISTGTESDHRRSLLHRREPHVRRLRRDARRPARTSSASR